MLSVTLLNPDAPRHIPVVETNTDYPPSDKGLRIFTTEELHVLSDLVSGDIDHLESLLPDDAVERDLSYMLQLQRNIDRMIASDKIF